MMTNKRFQSFFFCIVFLALTFTTGHAAVYDWSQVPVAGSITFNSIAYGNGRWAAATDNVLDSYDVILSSPNGVEWSMVTTPRNQSISEGGLSDVAFGGDRWIAVGTERIANVRRFRILTSTDGILWGAIPDIPEIPIRQASAVAYGDGVWIAVGQLWPMKGVGIIRSENGLPWKEVDSAPDGITLHDVACHDGRWNAVGYDSSLRARILSSHDGGRTWYDAWTVPSDVSLNCIAYGDGLWVVGCDRSEGWGYGVLISGDGYSWGFRENSIPFEVKSLLFADDRWIATGDLTTNVFEGGYGSKPVIATSLDGTSWEDENLPPMLREGVTPYSPDTYNAIAFSDGKLIAVGDYNSSSNPTNQVTMAAASTPSSPNPDPSPNPSPNPNPNPNPNPSPNPSPNPNPNPSPNPSPNPNPQPLPPSAPTFSREPADNGLGALRFGSDGRLGFLFYEFNRPVHVEVSDDQLVRKRLVYRQREASGFWGSEKVIIDFASDAQEVIALGAAVHFDSTNSPLVFVLQFDRIDEYAAILGTFSRIHSESPPAVLIGDSISLSNLATAQAPDGSVHFLISSHGFTSANQLLHATRSADGNWTWEAIPTPEPIVAWNTLDSFDWVELDHLLFPRCFSITVDPNGKTHVVFSHNRVTDPIPNGSIVRSSIFYATNAAGTWQSQRLLSPGAGFGDYGGLGASIASAPDGTVAVAASIIPRAPTGSPGVAWLAYLTRSVNGTWTPETIASRSSNYRMGDGERGTGINPILTFDRASRPHVVFTDHASEHFPGVGAKSMSGQVRYATRASARTGTWDVRLVVSANGASPFDFRTVEPTVAADNSPIVASVTYLWDSSLNQYRRTFHFLETLTDLSQPDSSIGDSGSLEPPELEKFKLSGSGKKLKITGTDLDGIKKIKVAGTKVKSFKVRGGKRLIIKFTKPLTRPKTKIRIVTESGERQILRVKL